MRQIVMRKSFASVVNDEKQMRQAWRDLVDVGRECDGYVLMTRRKLCTLTICT